MDDFYRSPGNSTKPDPENSNRKLKRLRTLLIIWVLAFLFVVIWFMLSARH
jgi:hypothetical protein